MTAAVLYGREDVRIERLPVPTPDPGEIVVRGPNVFCEYWGNEGATREALHDGRYRTGDIGRRDPDGYFWVLDRKKNLIISGGEHIYPAEVERVLVEHPAHGRLVDQMVGLRRVHHRVGPLQQFAAA